MSQHAHKSTYTHPVAQGAKVLWLHVLGHTWICVDHQAFTMGATRQVFLRSNNKCLDLIHEL